MVPPFPQDCSPVKPSGIKKDKVQPDSLRLVVMMEAKWQERILESHESFKGQSSGLMTTMTQDDRASGEDACICLAVYGWKSGLILMTRVSSSFLLFQKGGW